MKTIQYEVCGDLFEHFFGKFPQYFLGIITVDKTEKMSVNEAESCRKHFRATQNSLFVRKWCEDQPTEF